MRRVTVMRVTPSPSGVWVTTRLPAVVSDAGPGPTTTARSSGGPSRKMRLIACIEQPDVAKKILEQFEGRTHIVDEANKVRSRRLIGTVRSLEAKPRSQQFGVQAREGADVRVDGDVDVGGETRFEDEVDSMATGQGVLNASPSEQHRDVGEGFHGSQSPRARARA
jgi:hypothetical protein